MIVETNEGKLVVPVVSETSGEHYHLTLGPRIECSCPFYRYNWHLIPTQLRCKHIIRWLASGEGHEWWEEREERTAKLFAACEADVEFQLRQPQPSWWEVQRRYHVDYLMRSLSRLRGGGGRRLGGGPNGLPFLRTHPPLRGGDV